MRYFKETLFSIITREQPGPPSLIWFPYKTNPKEVEGGVQRGCCLTYKNAPPQGVAPLWRTPLLSHKQPLAYCTAISWGCSGGGIYGQSPEIRPLDRVLVAGVVLGGNNGAKKKTAFSYKRGYPPYTPFKSGTHLNFVSPHFKGHQLSFVDYRRLVYNSSYMDESPRSTSNGGAISEENGGASIIYNFNEHLNKNVSGNNEFFWNQCFDKGRLKNFVLWFVLNYGEQKTLELVEELKNLGFKYATKAGISLGIDDLKIPPKKADLIFEGEKVTLLTIKQYKRGEITGVERFQRLIDTWHRTSENLKQEVIDYFEKTDRLNPVYMMAFSGARGNISQVRQLVGMRGLMSNPQGQIIDYPIRSNFREGLTLTEYIISSYGARKGIVDTALRTANAGYLTRRLVDVAQHVIISNFDCKTNSGIFLKDMKEGNKIIYSLQNRLVGRVLAENINISNGLSAQSPEHSPPGLPPKGGSDLKKLDQGNPFKGVVLGAGFKIIKKNTEISLDLSFDISKIHKKVLVRSVLTCNNKKLVCQLCYGWSLAQGNLVSIGEAVGIIAAQSIGEPGTQLTMRTFHTGGVFSGGVTDQIKAPFDSFIEYRQPIPGKLVRTPEGKIAFLTTNEGFFTIKDSFNNACPPPIKGLKFNPAAGTTPATPRTTQGGLLGLFSGLQDQAKPIVKKYKIPIYTLLFKRMGEKVFLNEVIAQISSLSNQKNATDDEELTIKSELEGQLYGKGVLVKLTEIGPKLRKDEHEDEEEWGSRISFDPLFQAAYRGDSWILSGKIYRLPLASSFFPMIGDFINRKTVMNQIKWKFHKEGFLSSSSLEFYSNIMGTALPLGATQNKQIKPINLAELSLQHKIQPSKFNGIANPSTLNSLGHLGLVAGGHNPKTNLISSYFNMVDGPPTEGNQAIKPIKREIYKKALNIKKGLHPILTNQSPPFKKKGAAGLGPTNFKKGGVNKKPKSESNKKTEIQVLPTNGMPIVNVPSIKHSLLSFNVKNVVYKKYGYSIQVASGINPEFILNQRTNKYSKGGNRNNNKSLSKEDILLLISPLKPVENRKKGYDQNLWSGPINPRGINTPKFHKKSGPDIYGRSPYPDHNIKNLRWGPHWATPQGGGFKQGGSSRVYLSNQQLNPFLNLSKSPSNWVPNFPFFLNWYPSNFQMPMPGIVFLETCILYMGGPNTLAPKWLDAKSPYPVAPILKRGGISNSWCQSLNKGGSVLNGHYHSTFVINKRGSVAKLNAPSALTSFHPTTGINPVVAEGLHRENKVKMDSNFAFLPMKKPRFFLLNKKLKKQKENQVNFLRFMLYGFAISLFKEQGFGLPSPPLFKKGGVIFKKGTGLALWNSLTYKSESFKFINKSKLSRVSSLLTIYGPFYAAEQHEKEVQPIQNNKKPILKKNPFKRVARVGPHRKGGDGESQRDSFLKAHNLLNFNLKITPKGFIKILSLDKENKYKFQLDLISKSTILWASKPGVVYGAPPLRGAPAIPSFIAKAIGPTNPSRGDRYMGKTYVSNSPLYGSAISQGGNLNSNNSIYASFIKKEFIKKMQKQPNKKSFTISRYKRSNPPWGCQENKINKEVGESLHIDPQCGPPQEYDLSSKLSGRSPEDRPESPSTNQNMAETATSPLHAQIPDTNKTKAKLHQIKQNLKTQIECYELNYSKAFNSRENNPRGVDASEKSHPQGGWLQTLQSNSVHFGVRWKNSYNYKQNLNFLNLKVPLALAPPQKKLKSVPLKVLNIKGPPLWDQSAKQSKFYFWEEIKKSKNAWSENVSFKQGFKVLNQSLKPWTKVVSKQRSSDVSIDTLGGAFGRIFFTSQLFYEIPYGAPPNFSVLLKKTSEKSVVGFAGHLGIHPGINYHTQSSMLCIEDQPLWGCSNPSGVAGVAGINNKTINFENNPLKGVAGINDGGSVGLWQSHKTQVNSFSLKGRALETTKSNNLVKLNTNPFCYQINRQGFVKFAYSLTNRSSFSDFQARRNHPLIWVAHKVIKPARVADSFSYKAKAIYAQYPHGDTLKNMGGQSSFSFIPKAMAPLIKGARIYKGAIDFYFLFQTIKKSLFISPLNLAKLSLHAPVFNKNMRHRSMPPFSKKMGGAINKKKLMNFQLGIYKPYTGLDLVKINAISNKNSFTKERLTKHSINRGGIWQSHNPVLFGSHITEATPYYGGTKVLTPVFYTALRDRRTTLLYGKAHKSIEPTPPGGGPSQGGYRGVNKEEILNLSRLLYFFNCVPPFPPHSQTPSNLKSFSKTIRYMWVLENKLSNVFLKNKGSNMSIFNFCVLSCIKMKSRKIWKISPNFKKKKSKSILKHFLNIGVTRVRSSNKISKPSKGPPTLIGFPYKKGVAATPKGVVFNAKHRRLGVPSKAEVRRLGEAQAESNEISKSFNKNLKSSLGWISLRNILSKFIKFEFKKQKYISTSSITPCVICRSAAYNTATPLNGGGPFKLSRAKFACRSAAYLAWGPTRSTSATPLGLFFYPAERYRKQGLMPGNKAHTNISGFNPQKGLAPYSMRYAPGPPTFLHGVGYGRAIAPLFKAINPSTLLRGVAAVYAGVSFKNEGVLFKKPGPPQQLKPSAIKNPNNTYKFMLEFMGGRISWGRRGNRVAHSSKGKAIYAPSLQGGAKKDKKNKLTILLNPGEILIKKKLLCSKKDIIKISKISIKCTPASNKFSIFKQLDTNPKNKFSQIILHVLNPPLTPGFAYSTEALTFKDSLHKPQRGLNPRKKVKKVNAATPVFLKGALINRKSRGGDKFKEKVGCMGSAHTAKSQSLKRKYLKTKNSYNDLVHKDTNKVDIQIKFGWIYFSNSPHTPSRSQNNTFNLSTTKGPTPGGVPSKAGVRSLGAAQAEINKKYIFPGLNISDNLIVDNHICYVELLRRGTPRGWPTFHRPSQPFKAISSGLTVRRNHNELKSFEYKYSFAKLNETLLNPWGLKGSSLSYGGLDAAFFNKNMRHANLALLSLGDSYNKNPFKGGAMAGLISRGHFFKKNSNPLNMGFAHKSPPQNNPNIIFGPPPFFKKMGARLCLNPINRVRAKPREREIYGLKNGGDAINHPRGINPGVVIDFKKSSNWKWVANNKPEPTHINKYPAPPLLIAQKYKCGRTTKSHRYTPSILLDNFNLTHIVPYKEGWSNNGNVGHEYPPISFSKKRGWQSIPKNCAFLIRKVTEYKKPNLLEYKNKLYNSSKNAKEISDTLFRLNPAPPFLWDLLPPATKTPFKTGGVLEWPIGHIKKLNLTSAQISLMKKLVYKIKLKSLFKNKKKTANYKLRINIGTVFWATFDMGPLIAKAINLKKGGSDSGLFKIGPPISGDKGSYNFSYGVVLGAQTQKNRGASSFLNNCSYKFKKLHLLMNKKFLFNKPYNSYNLKQKTNLVSSSKVCPPSVGGQNEQSQLGAEGTHFNKYKLKNIPKKKKIETITKFPNIDLKIVSNFKFYSSSKGPPPGGVPSNAAVRSLGKAPLGGGAILYRKPKLHSLFLSYQISYGLRGVFEKDLYFFNYKNLRLTFNFQKFMYTQSPYPINTNLNSFLQHYLNKLTIAPVFLKRALIKRSPVLKKEGTFLKGAEIFSLIPIIFNSPYFSYNFIQKLDNRFMVENNFLNILSKLDVKNKNNELTNFSLTPKKIEIRNQFFTSGQNQLRSSNSFLPTPSWGGAQNQNKRYTNFAKNIVGVTSSYSAFQGEVIYTKDLAKIYKTFKTGRWIGPSFVPKAIAPPFLKKMRVYGLKKGGDARKQGVVSSKRRVYNIGLNNLANQNFKKFSDSPFLQNSALILTKEDLISVSLKQKKSIRALTLSNTPTPVVDGAINHGILNNTPTFFKKVGVPGISIPYSNTVVLKKEKLQIIVNNKPVLTNLDLLLQPSRIIKKQISNKKSITTTNRFSKYHITNILKEFENQYLSKTVYYLNGVIIKYKKTARLKKFKKLNLKQKLRKKKKNDLRNARGLPNLEKNGKYLINKLVVGLPIQKNNLSLGEFFKYGDKLQNNLTILETGQIIHLSKDKVTLRRGQRIKISINAILHKYHTDLVTPQSPVITLSYSQLKTGDIVQGIPKIEQFFEARTTKRGRLFRTSLPNLLQALFKYKLANFNHYKAARESIYKIQQILIDGVQRVYRGQGVTIADKHLEVIVKQMTSKARIIKGGSTGYLPGDVDDLFLIETVYRKCPFEFEYEPLILGISKTALEVRSFLSAASFQHTTRVLTKAAIYRETDYLSGLKENILLGNLIPAGTGYLVSVDPKLENQKI